MLKPVSMINHTESIKVTSTQSVFTISLSSFNTAKHSLLLKTKNNRLITGFTVSDKTITLTTPLQANDVLFIIVYDKQYPGYFEVIQQTVTSVQSSKFTLDYSLYNDKDCEIELYHSRFGFIEPYEYFINNLTVCLPSVMSQTGDVINVVIYHTKTT